MKFLAAILVYAFMAFVIGWGILQAAHGSYWLLLIGCLGYLVLLTKIGCLPPKGGH